MQVHSENKYHLLDLHKEIDLFDRKIAHTKNIESFDSEDRRTSAVKRLETKRTALVTVAVELANKGVEYDPKSLPRSFKAAAERAAD